MAGVEGRSVVVTGAGGGLREGDRDDLGHRAVRNFGQANYGAAKLGIVGLVNTLAIEGKKLNILANAVSPLARTRMSEEILGQELDPDYASALVV